MIVIQLLTKYLDTEEIGIEALKNLRAAIKEKEKKKPVVAKTEEESVGKPAKLEHDEKIIWSAVMEEDGRVSSSSVNFP